MFEVSCGMISHAEGCSPLSGAVNEILQVLQLQVDSWNASQRSLSRCKSGGAVIWPTSECDMFLLDAACARPSPQGPPFWCGIYLIQQSSTRSLVFLSGGCCRLVQDICPCSRANCQRDPAFQLYPAKRGSCHNVGTNALSSRYALFLGSGVHDSFPSGGQGHVSPVDPEGLISH